MVMDELGMRLLGSIEELAESRPERRWLLLRRAAIFDIWAGSPTATRKKRLSTVLMADPTEHQRQAVASGTLSK